MIHCLTDHGVRFQSHCYMKACGLGISTADEQVIETTGSRSLLAAVHALIKLQSSLDVGIWSVGKLAAEIREQMRIQSNIDMSGNGKIL